MNYPTTREEIAQNQPDAAQAPYGPPPAALPASEPECDWIVCDGCGRTFITTDGPGMIAAIKGPCPDCGGAFELVGGPRQSP